MYTTYIHVCISSYRRCEKASIHSALFGYIWNKIVKGLQYWRNIRLEFVYLIFTTKAEKCQCSFLSFFQISFRKNFDFSLDALYAHVKNPCNKSLSCLQVTCCKAKFITLYIYISNIYPHFQGNLDFTYINSKRPLLDDLYLHHNDICILQLFSFRTCTKYLSLGV